MNMFSLVNILYHSVVMLAALLQAMAKALGRPSTLTGIT